MDPPPGFFVKRGVRGKPSGDLDRTASVSSQNPGTPTASLTPAASGAPEDTPFGFGAATVPLGGISGSLAAFKRRCEWFYVDPAGEEHGPVSFQKLLSWYKKGHFPDDVKVRCRSPWYGVAGLIKSMEEAPDSETPTAGAAAHRLGSFSVADGLGGPLPPPPPPPPRTSSSALGLLGGPPSYDAELKLLFFGDPAWSLEPVWFYIDVRDVVQGPFSAREMVGWVASGMLKEDTRACGADPAAGVPTRNLFQPIGELLAGGRRSEQHRPFGLDAALLRRKGSSLGSSGGSGLLGVPPPPPPPPPPRRADSLTAEAAATASGAFGAPGRSDAPTWRKDIPPPGSANSSGAGAAGGLGNGGSSGGGSASGAGGKPGAPGGKGPSETGSASEQQADGAAADGTAGDAAGGRQSSEQGGSSAAAADGPNSSSATDVAMAARLASYHDSNAAALDDALAPEDDFEYGEDFKRKRQQERQQQQQHMQQQHMQQQHQMQMQMQQQQAAAAARAGGAGRGAPGMMVGGPGSGAAGLNLQGLNSAQVQVLLQQAQAQLGVQGQQQPGQQQPQLGMMVQQGGQLSAGMVPASAPIALATAAGGGLSPALVNSLMSMQLQQGGARPQLQQMAQVPGSSGMMLVSLPMAVQQQQPQQQQMAMQVPGQPGQQPVALAVNPQIMQLVNSGQLQQAQVMQLLQQQQQQQQVQVQAQQQQAATAQQQQMQLLVQQQQAQQQQQQQKQAAQQQQALQQQMAAQTQMLQQQQQQQQQQGGAGLPTVLSGPSSQGAAGGMILQQPQPPGAGNVQQQPRFPG